MTYVANTPRTYLNMSVGSGQCVPLVEAATGAPRDASWSRGKAVRNSTDIAVGTAIATFDGDGRYGNHTNGSSHAAIYMGQTTRGVQVIDQFVSIVNHRPVVQMAHERTIAFHGGVGKKSNDGDQLHFVN